MGKNKQIRLFMGRALVFALLSDLPTNFERISDHCSNISLDVLDSGDEEFLPHEYHMSMDYRQNEVFQNYFGEYKKKYNL